MFACLCSVLTDRCRRVSFIACRLPTRAVLNFARGEEEGRGEEKRRGEGEASKAGQNAKGIEVRELKIIFINQKSGESTVSVGGLPCRKQDMLPKLCEPLSMRLEVSNNSSSQALNSWRDFWWFGVK